MEATNKESELAALELGLRILGLEIKPISDAYHGMLDDYSQDGGFLQAFDLFNSYLFGEPNAWLNTIDTITMVSNYFPYLKKEKEIRNKITNELKGAKGILDKAASSKDSILSREEFCEILVSLQNLGIYLGATVGRFSFMSRLLQGEKYSDVINSHKNEIDDFLESTNANKYIPFYMRIGSFLPFLLVDAYDNSFLYELKLKGGYDEEILHGYTPFNGFEKFLFRVEDKLKEWIRERLKEEEWKAWELGFSSGLTEILCFPGMLKERTRILGQKKVEDYIEKIYGKEKKSYGI